MVKSFVMFRNVHHHFEGILLRAVLSLSGKEFQSLTPLNVTNFFKFVKTEGREKPRLDCFVLYWCSLEVLTSCVNCTKAEHHS